MTGCPDSTRDNRRVAPKVASASTSTSTDGDGESTSTRSPCSSAVLAVAGPITAITVLGYGPVAARRQAAQPWEPRPAPLELE